MKLNDFYRLHIRRVETNRQRQSPVFWRL